MFADIPWLAVVIAVVGNMMLGMTWYSPALFGNMWAESLGFKATEMKPTPWHFLGAFTVSSVIAIGLATISRQFHIDTVRNAFCTGFLLWLALVATTHFSSVIWGRKPLKVYLIDTSYILVAVVLILTLFALWPW